MGLVAEGVFWFSGEIQTSAGPSPAGSLGRSVPNGVGLVTSEETVHSAVHTGVRECVRGRRHPCAAGWVKVCGD